MKSVALALADVLALTETLAVVLAVVVIDVRPSIVVDDVLVFAVHLVGWCAVVVFENSASAWAKSTVCCSGFLHCYYISLYFWRSVFGVGCFVFLSVLTLDGSEL